VAQCGKLNLPHSKPAPILGFQRFESVVWQIMLPHLVMIVCAFKTMTYEVWRCGAPL